MLCHFKHTFFSCLCVLLAFVVFLGSGGAKESIETQKIEYHIIAHQGLNSIQAPVLLDPDFAFKPQHNILLEV